MKATAELIYRELKGHVGRENAIRAEELAEKFGVGERQLRDHIREIRRDAEAESVVASCNSGYYICTKDELLKANERLYSQAFSLLKTANANEKKVGRSGQMKMRLDEMMKGAEA